eukprot:TRINITY_DN4976_c0_g2_i1.p1 TRINITY_DN4976_c0_g2~~TRINITY_DN4976_c0_g2_i1.p1  ORF type:complete len:103 (+),score=31.22 TRINITY_DN4976_c0_g2_i1:46-309(+)
MKDRNDYNLFLNTFSNKEMPNNSKRIAFPENKQNMNDEDNLTQLENTLVDLFEKKELLVNNKEIENYLSDPKFYGKLVSKKKNIPHY